jgi:methyltransferase (TIGR00027 family)
MKPISRTAFYCCGIRMQDAENTNPICDDTYARAFMNEEALKFLETFKDDIGPNLGNVVRHRIIDDLLRRELGTNLHERILIIGAGFDTRAYRLKGGSWIEFDEPQVIAYKNERLPAGQSANELERIAVDFATESLDEKLSPFATREQVAVVVEGVLMYLEENQISEMLQTLRHHFPKHKLICDLMKRDFFEKYARPIHGKVANLGAPFKYIVDDPAKVFLESGYELTEQIAIVQQVIEFIRPNLTEEELKTLPASAPQGYDIYVFEFSDEAG